MGYFPVFTYCMESPWFLKMLPSARIVIVQPHLLFISRDLRQNWRLHRFLFLFFFRLIDRLSGRVHEPRCDKDDQIAFDVLIDIGAEQAAARSAETAFNQLVCLTC
jgi:hypothetical protein